MSKMKKKFWTNKTEEKIWQSSNNQMKLINSTNNFIRNKKDQTQTLSFLSKKESLSQLSKTQLWILQRKMSFKNLINFTNKWRNNNNNKLVKGAIYLCL